MPTRANQIKENKRQYRARRKDYVTSLEKRLAEYRKQGVQATEEVQLAARKVVRQNQRLRLLLKKLGQDDAYVEAWVAEDEDLLRSSVRIQMSEATTDGQNLKSAIIKRSCSTDPVAVASAVKAVDSCAGSCRSAATSLDASGSCRRTEERPVSASPACGASADAEPSLEREEAIKPCKIFTALAKNPAADVTQLVPEDRSIEQTTQGVECGAAYKMVMQYASSETKLEGIATLLEKGCVKNKDGGCSVKNSTIWQILDEHCV